MTELYRTTIVIYTDHDTSDMEIDDITRNAMSGPSLCIQQDCVEVEAEQQDDVPEAVLSFFDLLDEEEDEEA